MNIAEGDLPGSDTVQRTGHPDHFGNNGSNYDFPQLVTFLPNLLMGA